MWNGVSYTQSVDLRSKRKILRCITFVYYITANSLNIGACEKDGSHQSNSCIGRSIMFNNYGFEGLQAWNPNNKYNAITRRTSAAAGLTTGCIALLLCQDPTLTARQIYHILKDNAIQHTDYIQGEWNQYYGWGRINVPVLSNIKVKSDEELFFFLLHLVL